MPIKEGKKIWLNGEFVDWKDANIHILTHGIHYGSGVFEGIRCYNTTKGPAVFKLDEHLHRLYYSARVCFLEIPYSFEEIKKASLEAIKLNDLKECYIRPVVYFGYSSMGVHPSDCPVHIAIAVWPWGKYLGEEGFKKGVRTTISPWRKIHSSMVPTTAKVTGAYINGVLAARDARSKGYDEAIILNADGDVAEGPGANLFIVKNGVVYTNQADSSILLGITRDTIIQLTKDLGFPCQMKRISVGELFTADEVFFTGTAAEVTPVREIDGRQIGKGRIGEITEKIQSTYFDVVNARLAKYENWLTFVS